MVWLTFTGISQLELPEGGDMTALVELHVTRAARATSKAQRRSKAPPGLLGIRWGIAAILGWRWF